MKLWQDDDDELIENVKAKLYDYHPDMVRRVWIPKPGKTEKRPLGIPTIIDRIIQEWVRNILEPIAEAQFFEHSYGFRPMRSADMAVARIKQINFTAKCYWVVEGDIKSFFDNINHERKPPMPRFSRNNSSLTFLKGLKSRFHSLVLDAMPSDCGGCRPILLNKHAPGAPRYCPFVPYYSHNSERHILSFQLTGSPVHPHQALISASLAFRKERSLVSTLL